jgi:hypothetical protein
VALVIRQTDIPPAFVVDEPEPPELPQATSDVDSRAVASTARRRSDGWRLTSDHSLSPRGKTGLGRHETCYAYNVADYKYVWLAYTRA